MDTDKAINKPVWRFIHSGNGSPAENMAIDEAMLLAHSEGRVPPTLRFYGWQPATLTLGYFQKVEEEVDLAAVDAAGIGLVRRLTGGRAVLHDQELTYSMVVSEDYPGMPTTVNEAYRVLSEGLLLGFQRLGLQAEMVHLGGGEKGKYSAAASAACFDSPSWYELVVEGRKIAGSAQTRQKGVVMQHGAILLELDVDKLFALLRFPSERVKERLQRSFSDKAVAINDLLRALGRAEVGLAEVEQAFYAGLEQGLGITLQPATLTDWEHEQVARLIAEKYGHRDWNFRR